MNQRTISSSFQKFQFSGIVLLSALLFGKLIFLLCTFHQGIDISDEGMHLLMYKYPQEYSVTIHNYHYMVIAILPQSLITVFNLRVFWLVADVLGLLILFAGCISFVRSRARLTDSFRQGIIISKATALLLFLFGANALALSIHDRIIAYNAFSSLFMNVSAGLLLLAFGRQSFTALCGLLISSAFFFAALELFIKPTAAVSVAAIEFILCIVFFRKSIGKVFLYSITGFATALAFMFLFVLPPLEIWLPNYLKGFELAHTSGYGSNTMLLYLYAIPTAVYLVFILLSNVPLYILLKWIWYKRFLTNNSLLLLLMVGHLISSIILLLLLQLISTTTFNFEIVRETSSTFYSAILLIPNTLVYQFLTARMRVGELIAPTINIRSILVCLFLLAIPYLTIFGSFSGLDISIYSHLFTLMALLFIVPFLFMNYSLLPKLMTYYVIFTTLLCSYFFIRHYIFYPTRMLQPLCAQKINVGNGEAVLMDSASASFVNELKQKVNNLGKFEYGTQIGLQPSLLHFLELKQPGNNFYLSVSITDDPDKVFSVIENMNAAYNDYFYKNYAKEIAQGPVLINAGVTELDISAVNKRMSDAGYYLSLVDSVYNPYLEREIKSNPKIILPFTYIYLPVKIEN